MAATSTSKTEVKEKKRKKEKTTKTFADLQIQLMNAVIQSKPKVVKRLMDQRIDPNCSNELGETPLMLACQLEDDENRRMIASFLLKRDANINTQDIAGNSAISNAIKSNDEQLVEILLEKGIEMSQTSGEGNSLLCCAAINGNVNIAKLILREVLKQKLQVDHKNMHGLTPLLLAAQGGHIDVAKMLVSTGKASVTIRDLDHFMTAEQWMKQSGLYTTQEIAFLSAKSRHRRKNTTKSLLESVMELESESSPSIFTVQGSKMEEEKQKNSFVSLPNISSPSISKKSDSPATRSMFDLPAIKSATSIPKSNLYSRSIGDAHFKTEQLPNTTGSKRDIFASSYLNKRKAVVERNRKSKFYAKGSLEPLHSDSVPLLPPPTLNRMNSTSEVTDERKNQDYIEKKQYTKLPPLQ